MTYDLKWKTLWQKEKLLVLHEQFLLLSLIMFSKSHLSDFKKLSAEASESVYMRERVNPFPLVYAS